MQAAGETDAERLRLQRLRAGEGRPGRRRERQPNGPRLRRPDRASAPSSAMLGDTVYTYGNSSLRGGVAAASPEAGHRRPERGQRLEPHRLHRHPGYPGRLRQRLPQRLRRGDRHALDAPGRCRSRARTASATSPRSWPTPAPRLRRRSSSVAGHPSVPARPRPGDPGRLTSPRPTRRRTRASRAGQPTARAACPGSPSSPRRCRRRSGPRRASRTARSIPYSRM